MTLYKKNKKKKQVSALCDKTKYIFLLLVAVTAATICHQRSFTMSDILSDCNQVAVDHHIHVEPK